MSKFKEAYDKHKNLKLAADELGMQWQQLYVELKREGVAVTGDKLRYGSDRDKLAAKAESEFLRIIPSAKSMNDIEWQSKYDFEVGSMKVDVKASKPRQLNKKYPAKSWSFSIKKQRLVCDFIVCFCYNDDASIGQILLVPSEFFSGLQTVSVSCDGHSKWLAYAVTEDGLKHFFASMLDVAA